MNTIDLFCNFKFVSHKGTKNTKESPKNPILRDLCAFVRGKTAFSKLVQLQNRSNDQVPVLQGCDRTYSIMYSTFSGIVS
jgi:hypothetical protein